MYVCMYVCRCTKHSVKGWRKILFYQTPVLSSSRIPTLTREIGCYRWEEDCSTWTYLRVWNIQLSYRMGHPVGKEIIQSVHKDLLRDWPDRLTLHLEGQRLAYEALQTKLQQTEVQRGGDNCISRSFLTISDSAGEESTCISYQSDISGCVNSHCPQDQRQC